MLKISADWSKNAKFCTRKTYYTNPNLNTNVPANNYNNCHVNIRYLQTSVTDFYAYLSVLFPRLLVCTLDWSQQGAPEYHTWQLVVSTVQVSPLHWWIFHRCLRLKKHRMMFCRWAEEWEHRDWGHSTGRHCDKLWTGPVSGTCSWGQDQGYSTHSWRMKYNMECHNRVSVIKVMKYVPKSSNHRVGRL